MELELLQLLLTVAESPSFREAARKAGLSQAAVSLKMQRLEELAPVPVFSVEGRRKVLIHYGRSLSELARAELSRLELSLEGLARKYDRPEQLTLRVGCKPEIFRRTLPLLKFPGRIDLHVLSSHDAVAKLSTHEIDLAIAYERPDSTELVSRKLFTSRSEVVLHKKLLKRGTDDFRALKAVLPGVPCVAYRSDGDLLRPVLAGLRIADGGARIAAVAEDWNVLAELVAEGRGFGIVPDYVRIHSDEVLRIRVPDAVVAPYDYFALYHRDLTRIPAFKGLLSG